MMLTDLADVCRGAGLRVVEMPGWRSRGRPGGMRKITGVVVHHTAGAPASRRPDSYPSLGVVRDGRAGLPGPLAQLGLGRDGTVYVIAAGRASHAGRVNDARFQNACAIGIEAENSGNEAWPQAQYDAYVRLCRALMRHYNCGVKGHKEVAVPKGRKPDPSFNMDQFRADITKSGGLVTQPAPGRDVARPTLRLRDRGPAVQTLQVLLIKAGIDMGSAGPDGIFGAATLAGVRHFQTTRGLTVDGVVGPRTWHALETPTPIQPKEPTMPDPKRYTTAVAYHPESPVDERLARGMGAIMNAHVMPADETAGKNLGLVYLVGGKAVRTFDRAKAEQVVEVAGNDRTETLDDMVHIVSDYLVTL